MGREPELSGPLSQSVRFPFEMLAKAGPGRVRSRLCGGASEQSQKRSTKSPRGLGGSVGAVEHGQTCHPILQHPQGVPGRRLKQVDARSGVKIEVEGRRPRP